MSAVDLVTEPGVYDMPAETYHADPVKGGSVSSTGARRLLPPSCPAKFRHEQDNPVHKDVFDFGTAAHNLVIGHGPEVVVIDEDNWRKKDAQQAKKDAHERGAVPLLTHDWETVQEMAAAIKAHPIAPRLLAAGDAERTLIWRDPATGVWCRARPDWLPEHTEGRPFIVVDYKTAASAEQDALSKSVANFGYHAQAAWLIEGVAAVGLAPATDIKCVFIAQEKTAPYVVTVFELDAAALAIGGARNRRALETYVSCREAGHWPAYDDGIAQISLPVWAEINDREEYAA